MMSADELVAFIGVAAVILAAIVKAVQVVKSAIIETRIATREVHQQLVPNGGSSLADKVNQMAVTLQDVDRRTIKSEVADEQHSQSLLDLSHRVAKMEIRPPCAHPRED